MRPRFEVAQLLWENWQWVMSYPGFSKHHRRTLAALRDCRTHALGGHIDACSECGCLQISYNSCRNRHCPKCQGLQREKWILARQQELLPVTYFHLVFTIPDVLNPYARSHPRRLYKILFHCAWQTIQLFAQDPKQLGAKPGATMILHTWGANLSLHPHIHCIVPGGGLTPNGKWKTANSKGKFLFPVKAMSRVFRARFVAALRASPIPVKSLDFKACFQKPWVVYARQPFPGPKMVIEYLGRYTHKIAISNHRILNIEGDQVTFSYKDYKQSGKKKSMTLQAVEFIRRFALHILPHGFVRIRHYGILASRSKRQLLSIIREDLGVKPPSPAPTDWKTICCQVLGFHPDFSRCCGAKLVRIGIIPAAREPPDLPIILTQTP